MIASIEPLSLILGNLYVIMAMQLALNWNTADCNTHSTYFQLVFLIVMAARIVVQEALPNKAITARTHRWALLFSSGFLLTGLAAYQTYIMWKHWGEFSYNVETKEGSLTCYQNRIVYVSEIAVCILTVCKDIVVVIMGRQKRDLTD